MYFESSKSYWYDFVLFSIVFKQASRKEKLVEFASNIKKRVFLEHQRRGILAHVIELIQTILLDRDAMH